MRKRSVGLILDEPQERRNELLALLEENKNEDEPVDNRKDRDEIVCRELLFTDEPIKAYYFTDKLAISEGTLTTSLNRLEKWFEKYQLTLVRRPGLGIFIEGSEIARRQATTSWLCSRISEKHTMGNLRKFAVAPPDNVLIDGINMDILSEVNQVLFDCENTLNLTFSDNGYLHLLIYISLAVQRMNEGNFITKADQSFSDIAMEPEYAVAEYIMRQLRNIFHLTISVDETTFLATYLSGQRIWPSQHRDLTEIRNLDIHQITLSIIKKVSDILDIHFISDSRLLSELSAHLQPTIARLRAGIPIENPLLEDFQTNYADIFKACEEGLSLLCPLLHVDSIPASETGFITIYFVMAKERIEKLGQRISVILVCLTGVGSSRLLASSLKKEYPDLDIRGMLSAFEIDNEKLKAEGIDLVISTVKLNISYRYLYVNPILTRQDKMLLDSKIKMLHHLKVHQPLENPVVSDESITREDVEFISALGEEIYRVLGNIRIGQAPVLQNRDQGISHAATLFAEAPEMEQHLYEVLKARDELADTYVKPFFALLLHGRSPQITRPCFGYMRLDPTIYEHGKIIQGAIISLIPSDPDNQVSAPVASEIIGALLEDSKLLKALQHMDDERFTKLLEVTLLRFYKKTIQERLGLKENLIPDSSYAP
ncbi:MAG: BglG family transcription antiterminator, partial [Clostridiales bacterium]|nr:BglG family transcription antiterminator [Clostridiales bacterium]